MCKTTDDNKSKSNDAIYKTMCPAHNDIIYDLITR